MDRAIRPDAARPSAAPTPAGGPLVRAARGLFIAAALAGVSAGAAGCKRNGSGPSDGREAAQVAPAPGPDGSPVDLYRAGRFSDAKRAAEAAIPSSKGRDREVNELTAGLSAHALKQYSAAEYYLQPLVGSQDPQIAGRAEAALGQIAQARGNHKYAADLLKRASEKLAGDDAARASVRAGRSMSRSGDHASAVKQYEAAADAADSAAVKAYAEKLTKEPAGPFTLQAGVFSNRSGADTQARSLAPAAMRAGLGAPRVVTGAKGGRTTFAVQVGTFPTRDQASGARGKLGVGQFVIVPQ